MSCSILGRIIRSSFKSRKYEILHRIHSDKYTSRQSPTLFSFLAALVAPKRFIYYHSESDLHCFLSDFYFLLLSVRPSLLEAIYDRFSSLLEDEEVGKLSKPAFKEALGEMEIANDDIRNTIYASWDNDRNGYVDFLELVEGVDAIFHEDHQSRLDRLFNVFDLDGNGRIDVGELEQIFNTFVKEQDPQLAQQKVAAIMAACDLDNSKNITRQGWFFGRGSLFRSSHLSFGCLSSGILTCPLDCFPGQQSSGSSCGGITTICSGLVSMTP